MTPGLPSRPVGKTGNSETWWCAAGMGRTPKSLGGYDARAGGSIFAHPGPAFPVPRRTLAKRPVRWRKSPIFSKAPGTAGRCCQVSTHEHTLRPARLSRGARQNHKGKPVCVEDSRLSLLWPSLWCCRPWWPTRLPPRQPLRPRQRPRPRLQPRPRPRPPLPLPRAPPQRLPLPEPRLPRRPEPLQLLLPLQLPPLPAMRA